MPYYAIGGPSHIIEKERKPSAGEALMRGLTAYMQTMNAIKQQKAQEQIMEAMLSEAPREEVMRIMEAREGKGSMWDPLNPNAPYRGPLGKDMTSAMASMMKPEDPFRGSDEYFNRAGITNPQDILQAREHMFGYGEEQGEEKYSTEFFMRLGYDQATAQKMSNDYWSRFIGGGTPETPEDIMRESEVSGAKSAYRGATIDEAKLGEVPMWELEKGMGFDVTFPRIEEIKRIRKTKGAAEEIIRGGTKPTGKPKETEKSTLPKPKKKGEVATDEIMEKAIDEATKGRDLSDPQVFNEVAEEAITLLRGLGYTILE